MEMNTVIRIQTLNEAFHQVLIHFEKVYKLSILPSAIGKLMGRLGSLTFVWKPAKQK